MKTIKSSLFILFASLTTFAGLSANAEQPSPLPSQLYPGYSTTVLNSYDDVSALYSTMPKVFTSPGFMRAGSQCFQRAEVWTYDMYRNRQVNAMKVFVFYTAAYKAAYQAMHGKKFIWWFHVAPYVVYKDATGTEKEAVLDPSFASMDPTYAAATGDAPKDGPLSMEKWSQLFVETGMPCKQGVPYETFKPELTQLGTEQCYLVRVPATDFSTEDLEARALGQKTNFEWNLQNVKLAIDKATVHSEHDNIKQRLGF